MQHDSVLRSDPLHFWPRPSSIVVFPALGYLADDPVELPFEFSNLSRRKSGPRDIIAIALHALARAQAIPAHRSHFWKFGISYAPKITFSSPPSSAILQALYKRLSGSKSPARVMARNARSFCRVPESAAATRNQESWSAGFNRAAASRGGNASFGRLSFSRSLPSQEA